MLGRAGEGDVDAQPAAAVERWVRHVQHPDVGGRAESDPCSAGGVRRLAVTAVGEWQAGLAGEVEWKSMLQRVLGLLADLQRVYNEYKTFAASLKGGAK